MGRHLDFWHVPLRFKSDSYALMYHPSAAALPVTITAARRNRDAALIATKALGLEFPTRGGFQLECRHPEIITLGLSILEGCGLIFVNYSHRHGPFLRRAIRWTLDPARTIVHVYELEIKEIGDAGAKT